MGDPNKQETTSPSLFRSHVLIVERASQRVPTLGARWITCGETGDALRRSGAGRSLGVAGVPGGFLVLVLALVPDRGAFVKLPA